MRLKSGLKIFLVAVAVLLAVQLVIVPLVSAAQANPNLVALKSQKLQIKIERLSANEFQTKFGNNLAIPRTNPAVLQLGRNLYSRNRAQFINEECGETAYGLLYAALSNPEISTATIDAVGEAADADMPTLASTYTSGHFKFYYTTTSANPDDNVTLAEIQATATILNNAWTDFAANFKEPKHYVSGGVKLIDVKVFYLGAGLYGQTGSSWNHIELNSKQVVKNSCRRQTTPVHELFHRVEYVYGYVSGTANMKWAVEGTASWSQKYRAPAVGDWMGRMNEGLNAPDLNLIVDRSYNACHYWCYLGQRTTGGASGGNERDFVKKVWATYETNGKNMKNAVDTAIKWRCGAGYNFDAATGWWMIANIYKDASTASAAPAVFEYAEDEWVKTCSGVSYGPLAHAPRTTTTINPGTVYNVAGSVASYGADYYVFNIANTVTKFTINVTAGSKNFGYSVTGLKDNAVIAHQFTPAGGWDNYSYARMMSAGQFTQFILVVMGSPNGGNYSISAKGLKLLILKPTEIEPIHVIKVPPLP